MAAPPTRRRTAAAARRGAPAAMSAQVDLRGIADGCAPRRQPQSAHRHWHPSAAQLPATRRTARRARRPRARAPAPSCYQAWGPHTPANTREHHTPQQFGLRNVSAVPPTTLGITRKRLYQRISLKVCTTWAMCRRTRVSPPLSTATGSKCKRQAPQLLNNAAHTHTIQEAMRTIGRMQPTRRRFTIQKYDQNEASVTSSQKMRRAMFPHGSHATYPSTFHIQKLGNADDCLGMRGDATFT